MSESAQHEHSSTFSVGSGYWTQWCWSDLRGFLFVQPLADWWLCCLNISGRYRQINTDTRSFNIFTFIKSAHVLDRTQYSTEILCIQTNVYPMLWHYLALYLQLCPWKQPRHSLWGSNHYCFLASQGLWYSSSLRAQAQSWWQGAPSCIENLCSAMCSSNTSFSKSTVLPFMVVPDGKKKSPNVLLPDLWT